MAKEYGGLKPDGIVGSKTWSRLNNCVSSMSAFSRPPFLSQSSKNVLPGYVTESPSVSLGRGFMFVVFEQLPEIGSNKVIRKVAVIPKNFALAPSSVGAKLSPALHAIGEIPSQWLSASGRPSAAPNIKGTPLLMDISKIQKAGGRIITTDNLVFDLQRHALRNPSNSGNIRQLINTISRIEKEILIDVTKTKEGSTPKGFVRKLSAPHKSYAKISENLWGKYTDSEIPISELERGLNSLDSTYKKAKLIGRAGRVLTITGIVFTAVDFGRAANQSVARRSFRPIGTETIRQAGGWGGALAGGKIGFVGGGAIGIETGPGAIITGAIGAIIFGAAGYFGADWIADHISEN